MAIIYRNPFLYQFAMRCLYGFQFKERYSAIDRLISNNSSITEICMGDAYLFKHFLVRKSISYVGLDVNERLVDSAKKKGINAYCMDIRKDEIPKADIVILQAGLYQFIPQEESIMKKLLSAASKKVIIAEPVKNLAQSRYAFVRKIAIKATNPGTGVTPHRFDKEKLSILFRKFGVEEIVSSRNGRELIGVFNTQ